MLVALLSSVVAKENAIATLAFSMREPAGGRRPDTAGGTGLLVVRCCSFRAWRTVATIKQETQSWAWKLSAWACCCPVAGRGIAPSRRRAGHSRSGDTM